MNEPVAWKSTLQSKWFLPNEDMETGKYDKQFWIPLYTNPIKDLTDEEIAIVKEAVGNYVCTIKMEIDQEKQAFKGYEHCSNLPALRSELKDAEQALAILRKASEK